MRKPLSVFRSCPLIVTGALLVLLSFSPSIKLTASSRPKPVPTGHNGRSASVEGRIFLRVPVSLRGGLKAVARRYTGSSRNYRRLESFNRHSRRKRLLEARVPIDLLLPVYRDEALKALFPKDRRVANGWEHAWGDSPLGSRESWYDIARWFAGKSKYGNNVAAANPRAGRHPKKGTRITVPTGLLIPAIRAIKPPPPPSGPGLPGSRATKKATHAVKKTAPKNITKKPPEKSGSDTKETTETATPEPQPKLEYGTDSKGAYAIYRLKKGEALYSAVVVRFTGNMRADDVNSMAMAIAGRSGIKDVTDIAVDYPIKIPLNDLLPRYLPRTDERYIAWAKKQKEMAGVTNTYKSAVLDGVVVILDPGHGGADRGAMSHGVWEDSYVYDIACRIHDGLEKRTKARVLMTLLVPRLGYRPVNKKRLTPNKGAVILTHPWFNPSNHAEIRTAVNLRWFLANQYYLHLMKEKISPERVVFTSIHADSLHPSLRGTMFYVPGDSYRSSKWCVKGRSYSRFREVKAKSCYRLSRKKLRHSEGLSMQLTRRLQKSFVSSKLALHPYDPTRDHVVRGRHAWVPAVLRNNIVPCSVLIEVCNLNNRKDAKLIRDPAYRQAVADAYIDALIAYYS